MLFIVDAIAKQWLITSLHLVQMVRYFMLSLVDGALTAPFFAHFNSLTPNGAYMRQLFL
jgi:hypothetical protein